MTKNFAWVNTDAFWSHYNIFFTNDWKTSTLLEQNMELKERLKWVGCYILNLLNIPLEFCVSFEEAAILKQPEGSTIKNSEYYY